MTLQTIRNAVLLGMLCLSPLAAQEAVPDLPEGGAMITPGEWQAYRDAYVTEAGRVVDIANGGISHSESQGYGLLLSYLAQDRATFERIWSFTRTELMIRDDGLVAWIWNPDAAPRVTDINNASDGDILIAYALARAGAAWGEPGKLQAAGHIARALAEKALVDSGDLSIILPGVDGFSAAAREDGPVVNPSYWVFEAFPVLDDLDPEGGWMEVHEDGRALMRTLTEGQGLPADWVSLAGAEPRPAEAFAPEFGYNNIRVPLYLMRDDADADLLARFAGAFAADDAPGRIDVTTGERLEEMGEPGYRLIGAALRCTLAGDPIPMDLQTFEATSYFGATLQLLTLDYLRRMHPGCLDPSTRGAQQEIRQ